MMTAPRANDSKKNKQVGVNFENKISKKQYGLQNWHKRQTNGIENATMNK
jgi:hypothetical protein